MSLKTVLAVTVAAVGFNVLSGNEADAQKLERQFHVKPAFDMHGMIGGSFSSWKRVVPSDTVKPVKQNHPKETFHDGRPGQPTSRDRYNIANPAAMSVLGGMFADTTKPFQQNKSLFRPVPIGGAFYGIPYTPEKRPKDAAFDTDLNTVTGGNIGWGADPIQKADSSKIKVQPKPKQ